MNKYDFKAEKMREHLKMHPHDYQCVVSLLKAESASIECERNKRKNEHMALVAKYRRLYYAKQSQ